MAGDIQLDAGRMRGLTAKVKSAAASADTSVTKPDSSCTSRVIDEYVTVMGQLMQMVDHYKSLVGQDAAMVDQIVSVMESQDAAIAHNLGLGMGTARGAVGVGGGGAV